MPQGDTKRDKELYYVKQGALYHKGPGRAYVREIDKAGLYPLPVARKIAEAYGCTVHHYTEELSLRISECQGRIRDLAAIRAGIARGEITYERPAEGLMPLWAMGDEIRAMPEGALKRGLLGLLAEHERPAGEDPGAVACRDTAELGEGRRA